MTVQIIIPAAGLGTRLGWGGPKALVPLHGTPMLVHTLRRFSTLGLMEDVLVPVPRGMERVFAEALTAHGMEGAVRVFAGGEERQDSVRIALEALEPAAGIVLIHDAARPFVPLESIRESIAAAEEHGAATVAIPAVDTVLDVDGQRFLSGTPDRTRLWACQTPQTFQAGVIREAHAQAIARGLRATDDATLVRLCGGRVKIVEGGPENFKITTPFDLRMAERMIEEGVSPCA